MGSEAFDSLARGMGSNIASAIVYQQSIGKAMQSALASVLESIAAQCIAYAIYAVALGFLRIAQYDYVAAAAAFKSAAMFGVAGMAAAAIGSVIAPKQDKAGASAAGGWDLPTTGGPFPTTLHAGEMVLPADIAVPLRQSVKSAPLGERGGVVVKDCHFYGAPPRQWVGAIGNSLIRQARFAGASI